MPRGWRLVGAIHDIEVIAAGQGVRVRRRLTRYYGVGRWRKMKGIAIVELDNGVRCEAEIHWYEAHGVGRREFKLKRVLRWLD